jgi:hypothetical protein
MDAGAQSQWQTQQRAMQIEDGQRITLDFHHRRASQSRTELLKRSVDEQDDLGTELGQWGKIAHELNLIAQTLFAMNQYGFARDGKLT